YLEVMRKLQKTYRMEPAGSQGVWGLDDFQFLPFIWGSSQLIDHPYLEPRHFVDEKAVNENHKDYMFLECILFITEVRRRGEREAHGCLQAQMNQGWWPYSGSEEPELLPKMAGPAGVGY
ncbi:PTPA isoform 23, partial [Pan troglodytes]